MDKPAKIDCRFIFQFGFLFRVTKSWLSIEIPFISFNVCLYDSVGICMFGRSIFKSKDHTAHADDMVQKEE